MHLVYGAQFLNILLVVINFSISLVANKLGSEIKSSSSSPAAITNVQR